MPGEAPLLTTEDSWTAVKAAQTKIPSTTANERPNQLTESTGFLNKRLVLVCLSSSVQLALNCNMEVCPRGEGNSRNLFWM